MLLSRRFLVRIYSKDRNCLSGILEDARTGRETSFRNARELISLLQSNGSDSSTSPLPGGKSPERTLRRDTRQRRRHRKEDKA